MQKSRTYLPIIAVSLMVAGVTTGQKKGPAFSGFNGPDTSGTWANQAPVISDGIGIDDLTPISQPTPDYVGRTTIFDVTAPDLTPVASLTAGDCTVTFTPPLQARTVPGTWASWGSPPDTEGATGRVLFSNGATSITLALNPDCAAGTFGFEAEPNPFQDFSMTATYYNDTTSLGTVTRIVAGQAGARLFAADSDTPITRVVFSSTADFAIARVRYALPSGGAILFGTVTDSGTADPISGARVQAVGDVTRSRTTGPDGSYRMALPDGLYDVTASAFGYVASTQSVTVSSQAETQLDFALDSANRFALFGVVSTGDGTPLAGVQVTVLNTPLPPATTDVNGFYQFDSVPEGTYDVRAGAAASGGCTGSQTQTVQVSADTQLDFTVPQRTDTFGHYCRDGNPFDWIPGDTLSPLQGDDATLTVPLPFTFNYYGTNYTNVTLSTNGNMHFGPPNTAFSSVCLPSAGAISGLVAPLWDDLILPPGNIYTKVQGDPGSRDFIVEWRDVGFFAGGGMITMEVILHETTNGITFQYNRTDGRATGANAVIGIQNIAGTDALQYSCHVAGSASVGKRIDFYAP